MTTGESPFVGETDAVLKQQVLVGATAAVDAHARRPGAARGREDHPQGAGEAVEPPPPDAAPAPLRARDAVGGRRLRQGRRRRRRGRDAGRGSHVARADRRRVELAGTELSAPRTTKPSAAVPAPKNVHRAADRRWRRPSRPPRLSPAGDQDPRATPIRPPRRSRGWSRPRPRRSSSRRQRRRRSSSRAPTAPAPVPQPQPQAAPPQAATLVIAAEPAPAPAPVQAQTVIERAPVAAQPQPQPRRTAQRLGRTGRDDSHAGDPASAAAGGKRGRAPEPAAAPRRAAATQGQVPRDDVVQEGRSSTRPPPRTPPRRTQGLIRTPPPRPTRNPHRRSATRTTDRSEADRADRERLQPTDRRDADDAGRQGAAPGALRRREDGRGRARQGALGRTRQGHRRSSSSPFSLVGRGHPLHDRLPQRKARRRRRIRRPPARRTARAAQPFRPRPPSRSAASLPDEHLERALGVDLLHHAACARRTCRGRCRTLSFLREALLPLRLLLLA